MKNYLFINIETQDKFVCDENIWIRALETARNEGWEPDGTLYDFSYEVDELCDFDEDFMASTFRMLRIRNEQLEWEGSYLLRKNQVVQYEDSIYLAAALAGTGTDEKLLDFIRMGSFRICFG